MQQKLIQLEKEPLSQISTLTSEMLFSEKTVLNRAS